MILDPSSTEDKLAGKVTNGRELLHAIKETTHAVFDDDAAEHLDWRLEMMSQQLDARPGLSRVERDAILFFEGMLLGVRLKLTGQAQKAKAKLAAMGLLDSNGEPILPEN